MAPLAEPTWVVVDWNVFTMAGVRPVGDGRPMEDDRGVYRGRQVAVTDALRGIEVVISSPGYWVTCVVPIECVSQSERGREDLPGLQHLLHAAVQH
jgi:hypothetical protein